MKNIRESGGAILELKSPAVRLFEEESRPMPSRFSLDG